MLPFFPDDLLLCGIITPQSLHIGADVDELISHCRKLRQVFRASDRSGKFSVPACALGNHPPRFAQLPASEPERFSDPLAVVRRSEKDHVNARQRTDLLQFSHRLRILNLYHGKTLLVRLPDVAVHILPAKAGVRIPAVHGSAPDRVEFGIVNGVRTMAPDVIVLDELANKNDIDALLNVVGCGVKVIATTHSRDLNELRTKPFFREILKMSVFERFVVLSSRKGAGTIENIWDENNTCLYCG